MPRITVTTGKETTTLDYTGLSGLRHPGTISLKQLDFTKAKVKAGTNPWAAQLANLKTRKPAGGSNSAKTLSDLSWVPKPIAQVGRGSSGSPDQGGSDMMADMTAAYVMALIGYYQDDRARSSKSAGILNAWASTFDYIMFDLTTWSDGKLLAGWVGSLMGRTVELLKHTYIPRSGEVVPNWTNIDKMMRSVYSRASEWHNGSGGNWLAAFVDGSMQLSVALDDRAAFDFACMRWRRVVPSLFWLNTDKTKNPYPKLAGYPFVPPWTMWDNSNTTATTIQSIWGNPTSWPDGLEFEMFRDMHHTAMAFSGISNAAETAYNAGGVNLYAEEAPRLVAACELACRFIYEWQIESKPRPTGWPFNKDIVGYATSTQRTCWETLLMALNGRLGMAMPMTERLLNTYTRNNTYDVDLMNVGDQLTFQGTHIVG